MSCLPRSGDAKRITQHRLKICQLLSGRLLADVSRVLSARPHRRQCGQPQRGKQLRDRCRSDHGGAEVDGDHQHAAKGSQHGGQRRDAGGQFFVHRDLSPHQPDGFVQSSWIERREIVAFESRDRCFGGFVPKRGINRFPRFVKPLWQGKRAAVPIDRLPETLRCPAGRRILLCEISRGFHPRFAARWPWGQVV